MNKPFILFLLRYKRQVANDGGVLLAWFCSNVSGCLKALEKAAWLACWRELQPHL
jgi:hypothetical protein